MKLPFTRGRAEPAPILTYHQAATRWTTEAQLSEQIARLTTLYSGLQDNSGANARRKAVLQVEHLNKKLASLRFDRECKAATEAFGKRREALQSEARALQQQMEQAERDSIARSAEVQRVAALYTPLRQEAEQSAIQAAQARLDRIAEATQRLADADAAGDIPAAEEAARDVIAAQAAVDDAPSVVALRERTMAQRLEQLRKAAAAADSGLAQLAEELQLTWAKVAAVEMDMATVDSVLAAVRLMRSVGALPTLQRNGLTQHLRRMQFAARDADTMPAALKFGDSRLFVDASHLEQFTLGGHPLPESVFDVDPATLLEGHAKQAA